MEKNATTFLPLFHKSKSLFQILVLLPLPPLSDQYEFLPLYYSFQVKEKEKEERKKEKEEEEE